MRGFIIYMLLVALVAGSIGSFAVGLIDKYNSEMAAVMEVTK